MGETIKEKIQEARARWKLIDRSYQQWGVRWDVVKILSTQAADWNVKSDKAQKDAALRTEALRYRGHRNRRPRTSPKCPSLARAGPSLHFRAWWASGNSCTRPPAETITTDDIITVWSTCAWNVSNKKPPAFTGSGTGKIPWVRADVTKHTSRLHYVH